MLIWHKINYFDEYFKNKSRLIHFFFSKKVSPTAIMTKTVLSISRKWKGKCWMNRMSVGYERKKKSEKKVGLKSRSDDFVMIENWNRNIKVVFFPIFMPTALCSWCPVCQSHACCFCPLLFAQGPKGREELLLALYNLVP